MVPDFGHHPNWFLEILENIIELNRKPLDKKCQNWKPNLECPKCLRDSISEPRHQHLFGHQPGWYQELWIHCQRSFGKFLNKIKFKRSKYWFQFWDAQNVDVCCVYSKKKKSKNRRVPNMLISKSLKSIVEVIWILESTWKKC